MACQGMGSSPGWLECRMGKGERKKRSQERQTEAQLLRPSTDTPLRMMESHSESSSRAVT